MSNSNHLKEAQYIKISETKRDHKNQAKKVQRIVSSLVVLFCFGFLIMGGANLVSATSHAYILTVDKEEVATLVSESEAEQAIDFCLQNIKSSPTFADYDLDISYDNDVIIKQVPAVGVVYSSVSETADLLTDDLNVVADATAIRIDGVDAVFVADDSQAIEAVNAAKHFYADPKDDPSVIRVYTSEEISIAEAKVDLDEVQGLKDAKDMLLYGSTEDKADPQPMINVNVERTKTETEVLACTVVKQENSAVPRGKENVLVEGVDGLQEVTYTVKEVNGVVTGSTAMSSEVVVAAIDEVVEIGTQYYIASRNDSGGAGTFGWTCDGVITSRFGWRSRGWHSGIDIAAPIGTTLFASQPGTVIDTNSESGYGLVVRIDHGNGMVTVYSHCAEFFVDVGDQVDRNTAIAAIGMTGTTTGPHVHFEIRVDGQAVDPMSYL